MTDQQKPGPWIGWNGGECPVHPKTVVEVALTDTSPATGNAEDWYWDGDYCRIIAYRVIKEHREPRELHFRMIQGNGWRECHSEATGATLFREVLE